MLPFRTEIKNNFRKETINVYIKDTSCDNECKQLLKSINGIDTIEIINSERKSKIKENLTVFVNHNTDVSKIQQLIENRLVSHFAYD